MERYLREVISNYIILNRSPPVHEFIIFLFIKTILSIFNELLNLIAYFWPFFKVFVDLILLSAVGC